MSTATADVTFTPWPKIARLFRDVIITEKIDGTNAAVGITDGKVYAQSRSRIITPENDNFGFARWVDEYQEELRALLGVGLHFGEWWGSGIQRGYGLVNGEKRFSLFNTARHFGIELLGGPPGLECVPILYEGDFCTSEIDHTLEFLRTAGSMAVPGFMRPEGICVYHTHARTVFKVTLEGDQAKGTG